MSRFPHSEIQTGGQPPPLRYYRTPPPKAGAKRREIALGQKIPCIGNYPRNTHKTTCRNATAKNYANTKQPKNPCQSTGDDH